MSNCFSLYVGVAVLNFPQDWLWGRLLFGPATFLCACFGVGYAFFSTRDTWLYVETGLVWLWRHVSFVFFSTGRANKMGGRLL
jgi:hypothetical protein